jgi:hypothetical protein
MYNLSCTYIYVYMYPYNTHKYVQKSDHAVVYCRSCDLSFCEECGISMHQHPLLRNHPMGPLSGRKPMCSIHEDCAADMYCETEQVDVGNLYYNLKNVHTRQLKNTSVYFVV